MLKLATILAFSALVAIPCSVTFGQAAERADRSVIYIPSDTKQRAQLRPTLPVPAGPGPHVLVDDALIAASENLGRVVQQPVRESAIDNPIVRGEQDRCFQPYLTVSRSPETGRFRMWYGVWREDRDPNHSHLAYVESSDGIVWQRPAKVLQDPSVLDFGSEVIDRGPDYPDPAERYVYSYHHGGLRLAVSPDGVNFRPLVDRPVLVHDHDINSVAWDSMRKEFVAIVSTVTHHRRFSGRRRTTMQSVSTDLVNWQDPWFVLRADDEFDDGETQFYAMQGFLNRGPLRIGMVKVLRDDLRAEGTQENSYGMGWTALAWSRDGRTWVRDREIFFGPDPNPDAWDHAHTWVDEQLVVGDEVYLYYGGYKQGHKMNRFSERQIGLVTMPLDRYVARAPVSEAAATLKTVPFAVDRPIAQFRVNANAAGGSLVAQLVNAETGKVLPGLGFGDCLPLRADKLRASVDWGPKTQERLQALEDLCVHVEFRMTNARLYAFEFVTPQPGS
ncbi:MAG: hypothetical protein MI757_19005 [Pirellulales bacterium]|nr:hypothetical protein [Pirellulales bacterium]